jgi:hypothetical protein
MNRRWSLVWVLAPLALLATACTGRLARGTAAPHPDATQDIVVLVFHKGSAAAVEGTIYVDDVPVAGGTYGAESPKVRLRLEPGVHRVRANVAGVTGGADITVDAYGENVWQVIYRDEPLDLGYTVVPAGVLIERIRPI